MAPTLLKKIRKWSSPRNETRFSDLLQIFQDKRPIETSSAAEIKGWTSDLSDWLLAPSPTVDVTRMTLYLDLLEETLRQLPEDVLPVEYPGIVSLLKNIIRVSKSERVKGASVRALGRTLSFGCEVPHLRRDLIGDISRVASSLLDLSQQTPALLLDCLTAVEALLIAFRGTLRALVPRVEEAFLLLLHSPVPGLRQTGARALCSMAAATAGKDDRWAPLCLASLESAHLHLDLVLADLEAESTRESFMRPSRSATAPPAGLFPPVRALPGPEFTARVLASLCFVEEQLAVRRRLPGELELAFPLELTVHLVARLLSVNLSTDFLVTPFENQRGPFNLPGIANFFLPVQEQALAVLRQLIETFHSQCTNLVPVITRVLRDGLNNDKPALLAPLLACSRSWVEVGGLGLLKSYVEPTLPRLARLLLPPKPPQAEQPNRGGNGTKKVTQSKVAETFLKPRARGREDQVAVSALELLETCLLTCGPLLATDSRKMVDTLLLGLLVQAQGSPSEAYVCSLYGALTASLLSPLECETPLLPLCLPLYRHGLTAFGPKVARRCRKALAVLDSHVHPRAPPRLPSSQVTEQAATDHYAFLQVLADKAALAQRAAAAAAAILPPVPQPAHQAPSAGAPNSSLGPEGMKRKADESSLPGKSQRIEDPHEQSTAHQPPAESLRPPPQLYQAPYAFQPAPALSAPAPTPAPAATATNPSPSVPSEAAAATGYSVVPGYRGDPASQAPARPASPPAFIPLGQDDGEDFDLVDAGPSHSSSERD